MDDTSPKIAERYLGRDLTVHAGSRLHQLVAILFDTYYDDLTDDRIAQLEQLAQSWRWMNADGKRLR